MGAERPSTLVNNVQQRVLHYQVAGAFEGAVRAAMSVPQTGSMEAQMHARRQAAEQHLHDTLGQLGLEVGSLRLPPPPAMGQDIAAGASELVAK